VRTKKQAQHKLTDGIGFKLTVIISSVLLFVFVAKATYDAIVDYSSEIEENSANTMAQSQLLAANVERTFAEVYQTCLDLESLVQHELILPPQQRSRDRILTTLDALIKQNASVTGLSALFEPNAFDGNDARFSNTGIYKEDGRFIPYASKKGKDVQIRSVNFVGDTEGWYSSPLRTGKTVMVPPFKLYKDKNDVVTTLAIPIMHDGKAIGVIDADVDITSIQAQLEKIPGTTKQNFKRLCSANGTIVANGIDSSKILQNQFELNSRFKTYFESISRGETVDKIEMSNTTGVRSYFLRNRLSLGFNTGIKMPLDPQPIYELYTNLTPDEVEALKTEGFDFSSETGTLLITQEQMKKINPVGFTFKGFIEYNQPFLSNMEIVFGGFLSYTIYKPKYITMPQKLVNAAKYNNPSVDFDKPINSFYMNSFDFGVHVGLAFKV